MVKKKVTRKVTKRAAAPARSEVAPQGRRFDDAQKQHAVVLVASGVSRVQVAATIGTTTESLRRWVREATTAGTMPAPPVAKKASTPPAQQASRPAREKSPYAPADPAQGLSDPEVAAILEWKKKHPSMGPAQLRAQLKRFMGWRLSIKAIARVLRGHGYALVHTKARPVGPEPVRFEAPRRNALWQADFCEVRVGDERLHALILLDDHSRFIVGHALTDSPSSAVVTATFRAAMARHGKPEAVRTDRGGAFVAFTKTATSGACWRPSWSITSSGAPTARAEAARSRAPSVPSSASCGSASTSWIATRPSAGFPRGSTTTTIAEPIWASTAWCQPTAFSGAPTRSWPASTPSRAAGSSRSPPATAAPPHPSRRPSRPPRGPLEALRLVVLDGVMERRFCGARVQLGPLVT